MHLALGVGKIDNGRRGMGHRAVKDSGRLTADKQFSQRRISEGKQVRLLCQAGAFFGENAPVLVNSQFLILYLHKYAHKCLVGQQNNHNKLR